MPDRKVKNVRNFLCLAIFVGIIFSACRKDETLFTGNANLKISTDTLFFDTVFTTIGSATRFIKIFNNESDPIEVNIRLEKGSESFFRMNADGYQGDDLENIQIGPRDSIYVFLEVTIDPDMPNSISPFVIEENLIVQQGNKDHSLPLVAWGQNANYLSQKRSVALLSCGLNDFILDDPKPYVIYGVLVVDSCNLVIPAGAKIHVHGGIVVDGESIYNDGQLLFINEGTLQIRGTVGNPVIFEGSRLEPEYADIPGQWGGIRFLAGSTNNLIEYATIKNSIVGLVSDSASAVNIKNTSFENTAGSAVLGRHGKITAENVRIVNPGGFGIQLSYGGDYDFSFCTVASYFNQSEALYMDNYTCLDLDADPFCQSLIDIYRANLTMKNCVLAGGSDDEILFNDITGQSIAEDFVFNFEHCAVRVKDLLAANSFPNFFDNCTNCLNLKVSDRLFIDYNIGDVRLDSASVLIEKAMPIPSITIDLVNNGRDISTPDIGCYEY